MMRKIVILMMIFIGKISFSEINVKIFEPIRFKEISTKLLGAEKVVGIGILEITTDDLKHDKGKKLKFYFPKKGMMTNHKKWIDVEKYRLETTKDEFIITKKIEQVKIYAILDKRNIDKGEEADIIEGEYEGYIPIIISQYGKLPSREDK